MSAAAAAVVMPARTAAGAPVVQVVAARGGVYLSRFPRLRRQNLRARPFAVRARYCGCDSRDCRSCRVNRSSCARRCVTVPAAAVVPISFVVISTVPNSGSDAVCWWDLSTRTVLSGQIFDYLDLRLEKYCRIVRGDLPCPRKTEELRFVYPQKDRFLKNNPFVRK